LKKPNLFQKKLLLNKSNNLQTTFFCAIYCNIIYDKKKIIIIINSILLLKIKRTQKSAPYKTLHGKIYLIDLAGSEDNRRTGNSGIRYVLSDQNDMMK
jgi:hypothetical protein